MQWPDSDSFAYSRLSPRVPFPIANSIINVFWEIEQK